MLHGFVESQFILSNMQIIPTINNILAMKIVEKNLFHLKVLKKIIMLKKFHSLQVKHQKVLKQKRYSYREC